MLSGRGIIAYLSRGAAEFRVLQLSFRGGSCYSVPVPSNSGSSGSAASSTGGFLYPLPYAVPITDAYGYRIHPLSGTYKWHNGVDLAAGSGTAIYATQSGTVTSACYNEAYGNMVTINHANG